MAFKREGEGGTESLETTAKSDYIKFGTVKTPDGNRIKICVSYVDACSLFEKSPKPIITFEQDGAFLLNLPEYGITKFSKRRELQPNDQAATELFTKSISAILQGEEFPAEIGINPVAANLENLAQDALVNSLSTLMRAAEISTGQKFTYREIWGALARCVIGDLSVTSNSADLQKELIGLQSMSSNPRENFKSMQALAELRYHQSIFGLQDGLTVGLQHQSNPVTKIMAAVDPIRDSQPGYFDAQDEASGWVTPILDAFASSLRSGSPLEAILRQIEGNPDDRFPMAITSFDRKLDQAFIAMIADPTLKDVERNTAVRWYSTYLSRLYAVSNGICAFREQIATWVQIWTTAPILPFEIKRKFMSMLRPRRSGSEDVSSYIPIFDSRTISITSRVSSPKLAARLSDLDTVTRRDGDSVMLALNEHAVEVAETLLDFSLLRDALVCTPDDVGVSDVSSVNAPRLERFRAARLTPSMLAKNAPISILHGNSEAEVVVKND